MLIFDARSHKTYFQISNILERYISFRSYSQEFVQCLLFYLLFGTTLCFIQYDVSVLQPSSDDIAVVETFTISFKYCKSFDYCDII